MTLFIAILQLNIIGAEWYWYVFAIVLWLSLATVKVGYLTNMMNKILLYIQGKW